MFPAGTTDFIIYNSSVFTYKKGIEEKSTTEKIPDKRSEGDILKLRVIPPQFAHRIQYCFPEELFSESLIKVFCSQFLYHSILPGIDY